MKMKSKLMGTGNEGQCEAGEVDAELNTVITVYKNWSVSHGCSLSPLKAEGLDNNSMGQQERKAIQNYQVVFLRTLGKMFWKFAGTANYR